MAQVHHILNPSAAHIPWVKGVTEGLTPIGPWTWISREHPQHTETVVDWALKEGVPRLIVWGGDGTFHRVLRRLQERQACDKVQLALVPVGTCNDLARCLNLSKYYWRRWEAPSPQGRLAVIPLARIKCLDENHKPISEDIFVNNAGFGRPRSSFESKDGTFAVLKAFQKIPHVVKWDGKEMRGTSYMTLACNAPYFSGGLYFEKGLSPEKGELNIYFVPAASKVLLGLRLLLGRMGFPLKTGDTHKVSATRIWVETEVPVWPQADGEPPPEQGSREISFEVLPERVKIWVSE